jgi:ABC-type spermidine/putrescine transport system permease subunit II
MLPIVITLYKSFSQFSADGFDPFHWYKELVRNSDMLEGLRNSVMVAAPVGLATVLTAYFLGYTVWRSRVFLLTAFCLCFLVFVPASAYALGMAELQKPAGAKQAHLSVLGLCQVGSFLPFCFVVVVIAQVVLEPTLMGACMELGATRLRLVLAVVPRMVWPIITSSLLVGVLLSINDYTRPEFLGGSTRLLSRQINSQLQSTGDYTGYAAGSVLTMMAVFAVTVLWASSKSSSESHGR